MISAIAAVQIRAKQQSSVYPRAVVGSRDSGGPLSSTDRVRGDVGQRNDCQSGEERGEAQCPFGRAEKLIRNMHQNTMHNVIVGGTVDREWHPQRLRCVVDEARG